jgi:protein-L-isoaspartate(D-aspartate) O-methyltransferase
VNTTHMTGIGMTSQRTRDRLVRQLENAGIRDRRVLDVIANTPRHLFVDEAMSSRAYENTALPIGYGQTISQPYVVARMTEALLEGGPRGRVLEVGTGSGYQAAVLAALVERVYSVERIHGLQRRAREILSAMRVRNVSLRHSDGSWGWPEQGPFDAIMLTAAPREVPQALLEQLTLGGVLVAPVGGEGGVQTLVRITRHTDTCEQECLETVSFVPMLPGTAR